MESYKYYGYVHELLQDSSDNCFFTSGDFSLLGFFKKDESGFNSLSNFNAEENKNALKIILDSFGNIRVNNKLFIRKEYDMQKDDEKAFTESYRCEVERVDTKDPGSVQNVSNWIKQQTDKEKFEFFNWTSLNAVFKFSSEWAVNFDNKNNYKHKFRNSGNESADIDMMTIEGTFNYENDTELNVEVLEIPLKGEGLSMIIILPNTETDIGQLMQDISSYSFGKMFYPEQKHRISLHLPKFNVEGVMDFSQKEEYRKMPLDVTTTSQYYAHTVLSKNLLEVDELGINSLSLTSGKLLISPVVKEFFIQTDIASRFAKTLITNKVENPEDVVQETNFNVILPENAFISEFIMEIQGKSYKSYVRGKEEAKEEYTEAVSKGKSAAHVAVSARDSNKFTVNVNIAPSSTATFYLTYEELLQRICKQYQLVLNLHPGQLIDVLKVKVNIDESRKLKYVETPEFRSGNEISETEEKNPLTTIEVSDSKAVIRFEPTVEAQKVLSKKLGKKETHGISGQLVVNYDVELDPNKGEVLLNDGYFVYFYAPDDLPPLAKHVVFALDTSTSMMGRKIEQLRDAMQSILGQIRNNDLVSILEFNSDIIIHHIDEMTASALKYEKEDNYHEPFDKFKKLKMPHPKPANDHTIKKAKQVVSKLKGTGWTHMIGGLEAALYIVNMGQAKYPSYQPMIIFLTDGQPTTGITDNKQIVEMITKLNNANHKAPIFSLSFGEDADKSFLRELSLKNFGFSRHIYEASDASLQLQQFYKHISSPLLSNVKFKYESGVEEITRTFFPIYFCGTHIVISGRYADDNTPLVTHILPGGHTVCPVSKKSSTSIERLWAYLTVKQILDEKEATQDNAKLRKALKLALKYSFVTDVTSLVVVKPDEESTSVDIQNAMENENDLSSDGSGYSSRISLSNFNMGNSVACFMSPSPISCLRYHRRLVPVRYSSHCTTSRSIPTLYYRQNYCLKKKTITKGNLIKKKIMKLNGIIPCVCLKSEEAQNSSNEDIYMRTEIKDETDMANDMTKEEPEPSPLKEFKVDQPFFVMVKAKLNDNYYIVFAGKICKM